MATPTVSLRIPDEEREAAERHGRELGLSSFTDCTRAALKSWTGQGESAVVRRHAERADRAEAEADRLRDQLARLRAQVAGAAGIPVPQQEPAGPSREDRLIAALDAATPEFPVSLRHLISVSGYSASAVNSRVTWLRDHGYLTQPSKGSHVKVPGADVRAGIEAARGEEASAVREARRSAPRHVRPLSPGTAVFREPGASPVVGALAPEGKRGRR